MNWLWNLPIIDGPYAISVYVLAILFFVFLIIRPFRSIVKSKNKIKSWLVIISCCLLLGAMTAMSVMYLVENIYDLIGAPVPNRARMWIIVCFAAIFVAILNFWRSGWRRKVIASVAIIVFLCAGVLKVNAVYELNETLGALLNISGPVEEISLPKKISDNGKESDPYKNWQPPASMPSKGTMGSVIIPNNDSKFTARPARLYLPPAALVSSPPKLPIIILMMGQPGTPEQANILVDSLDNFAKSHNGLAPIVLSVDQTGSPMVNTMCINSKMGQVHTYVMSDVVKYIKSSLNVLQDRKYWVVGGYSNGGECALSFGAKHPDVFGSLISIAGEVEPSLGTPKKTLSFGFGGNSKAFEEEKPANIMTKTKYKDMWAIFTAGSNDPIFSEQARLGAEAASAAGMNTKKLLQPGGDHGGGMIIWSFEQSLSILAERLGFEQ